MAFSNLCAQVNGLAELPESRQVYVLRRVTPIAAPRSPSPRPQRPVLLTALITNEQGALHPLFRRLADLAGHHLPQQSNSARGRHRQRHSPPLSHPITVTGPDVLPLTAGPEQARRTTHRRSPLTDERPETQEKVGCPRPRAFDPRAHAIMPDLNAGVSPLTQEALNEAGREAGHRGLARVRSSDPICTPCRRTERTDEDTMARRKGARGRPC